MPAGTFQIAAELGRLFGGSERADHGAVIDSLGAEIGALDDWRTGPQRGGKLVLQRAIGGLHVGLVLLRGNLNQVIPAGRGSRPDGIGGGETDRRRRIGAGALCGDAVSGALALAMAADGLRWPRAVGTDADRAAGSGFAGAAAPVGIPPFSAGSPFMASTLILRGSLFGIVPFAAVVSAGPVEETLATGGGLLLWFSGRNTTSDGPDLELTSTGASSRDTSFSPPSPGGMRSGALEASPSDWVGTTLVALLSAVMIGGSPLRGEPT